MMARKADPIRTLNVAVVGVAGTEKERGQSGVGKSCLCNRFIKSLADDYHVEHISVLSQVAYESQVVLAPCFLVFVGSTCVHACVHACQDREQDGGSSW